MPDCAVCPLFKLEAETGDCLHVNRPGGLALTKMALDLCQLPSGSEFLDVASGTGATLNLLSQSGFQPIGIDLSFNMLKSSTSINPPTNMVQANCRLLPFVENSFSAILMECAFSLSGNLADTIQQFHRVLKPSGKLILSDIYLREKVEPGEACPFPVSSCLAGVISKIEIQRLFTAQGMRILHWQDHTPLLKQWLARLVFKLGSMDAVYQLLTGSENAAQDLALKFGSHIKLGYYLMVAEK